MLIIVEGPDCAGKTTFVNELRSQIFGALVVKTGPPNPPNRDIFEEYEQRVDKLKPVMGVVIFDRLHWGEWVYGPVFRGGGRGDVAAWRHIELFLASRGALVIYLHKPSHEIAECIHTRGDDFVPAEYADTINEKYRWCIENTILPTISLRMPSQFEASHLASMAVQRLMVSMAMGKTTYIGCSRPHTLLFGEKRGPKDTGDLACFVPRPASSGHFLLRSLPEFFWPKVGIANACEDDTKRPRICDSVESLWTVLGKPHVVALGRKASAALTKADVRHAIVPHPQYARRFHHSKNREYGDLIVAVAGTEEDAGDWKGGTIRQHEHG